MKRTIRSLNNLNISGSFGVSGSTNLNGNTTLGDNISDIIYASGSLINNGGASLTGSFSGSFFGSGSFITSSSDLLYAKKVLINSASSANAAATASLTSASLYVGTNFNQSTAVHGFYNKQYETVYVSGLSGSYIVCGNDLKANGDRAIMGIQGAGTAAPEIVFGSVGSNTLGSFPRIIFYHNGNPKIMFEYGTLRQSVFGDAGPYIFSDTTTGYTNNAVYVTNTYTKYPAKLHVSASSLQGAAVLLASSSAGTASVRISQYGQGDALIVEDETSPDNTPFIIKNNGKVGIGITTPSANLEVIGNISASAGITGSFSGSGALINNLTASNINNFTVDVRKQISGTGVISYDSSTGIISYTGAGGTIYTSGSITGSGTAGDPIRLQSNVTASSFTASVGISASYFYGDGTNLTEVPVQTAGNITGSGTSANKIGITPDPTFNTVTASYYTGSSARLNYIDMVPNIPAFNVGRLHYDTAGEILKFDLPYENTQLNIGKQIIAKVKNVTDAQINKGKVVYVNGAQGASEILYINTASWDSDPTSAYTFGFTMSDLAVNDIGYVILEGILEGISTTGFAAGSLLYLSSSGDFTTTKPIQPKHAVRLGYVAREQSVNGSVFVRIQNGYELDELHDVLITNSSSYDLLMLDSDGLWKNTKTLSGSYTFSAPSNFTQITASVGISGSKFFGDGSGLTNLPASSITVGGNITGSGTSENPYGVNTNPTFTTITASNNLGYTVKIGGAYIAVESAVAGPPGTLPYIGNTYISGGYFTSSYVSVGTLTASTNVQVLGQSHLSGGVKLAIASKTSNYTLTASSDYIVSFNGLNLTGTLPAATNIQGTVLVIKNLATSSVFVTSSTSTIDGNTTGITIYGQYTSYTFISDNTNWLII